MNIIHYSIFTVLFLPCLYFCLETDTISSTSIIKDPDSIVSPKQRFKFGFFSPDNTTNRYLGVFYAFSEKTVVWVANRAQPLHDSSGTITISKDGDLLLVDGTNQTVWSTNAATATSRNTTLQIQDTGNLVLRDHATGAVFWESFSQPTDVFMRGMKTSHNVKTGEKVTLSSWKNETDPNVGRFTCGIEARNSIEQSFIWDNGQPHWRGGPWNGQINIGVEYLYQPHLFSFSEVKTDQDGTFYEEAVGPDSIIVRLRPSGRFEVMLWDDNAKSWAVVTYLPYNECDIYGRCGVYGRCNVRETPICSCLSGFEPENRQEWERGNWSSGCRRKNQLQSGAGDGFLRMQYVKVPDFPWLSSSSNQRDDCMTLCSENCSCVAYAHEPRIGCMFWSDDLIDIQMFNGVGVDLYIRLSASELGNHKDKKLYIIVPIVAAFVCVLIFIFIAWFWMVKRKGSKTEDKNIFEAGQPFSSDSTAIVLKHESEKVNIGEFPQFSFEMLANATGQFCQNNLLGRGGFGPVYKGILANGKEIAVKRLSMASTQGTQEFMNEVIVISKLQHRNLVRLLGCCVEKEEKLLIYEYMPNKSLDACFLPDPSHPLKKVLDWTKRFNIIQGICRGLLYLHRDSRLRIIHRDLKPSNVLLDEDWNPKISDFGMARIFGGNQDHDNTARIVGTYGYMAPEYAMEGRFSEKSDVYSFGVIMLEIVKGEKNTHYYNHECSLSLLGYAWKLWSEDNGLAFADESLASLDFKSEIERCIQIALLCVQEFPNDRPTIQTVQSMLSHEIVDLPRPRQPVYNENWEGLSTGQMRRTNLVGYSVNELTVTGLDGR